MIKNIFKELKFALYAIKKNIQSSAELRTSFLMNIFGMAINNIVFILIWVFFVKSVGVIGGWTAADIIGLQGFTAVCYGLVFSAGGGLRRMADYVATGAFDRYLLSPKNLLLRVATSSFGASAVGDIIFGATCLIIYGGLIRADFFQCLLVLIMIILTVVVFFAMVVLIFSISFFFMDARSMTNGFFELFFTPSLFHGGAFQGAMRFVFIFIIPSLLIGTLPVEIVKNASLSKLALVAVFAIFWLIVSMLFFKKAVKKYESSNFMTFGN